ncbi:MAG: diheme cytochrome c-553 [Phaeodactylibacter sp.]|nr:diheme cytochrome c-553 [Phaeodactylibacter sp.]
MKKLFTVAIAIMAFACSPAPVQEQVSTEQLSAEHQIARGQYLVNVIGCNDCHSPKRMGPNGPEPDPGRLLSGYPHDASLAQVDTSELRSWALFSPDLTAAVGPWGVSYAANLTSDDTGIGLWTEAQFIKCMREGKYKGLEGSRPLLPPMPWPNFAQMTDDAPKADGLAAAGDAGGFEVKLL